jgi:hypothetical protein
MTIVCDPPVFAASVLFRFLNNVTTSPQRGKYTLTAEYKVTAVRIERL